MSGTLSPVPWFQFSDINGRPYAGGKLYVFDAGTNNPRAVYATAAQTPPALSQPIILDAWGECTVYLGATDSVKYVLYDANDVLVKAQDVVASIALSSALTDALTAIKQAQIGYGGSDAAALMGAAIIAGLTKAARAPGTGFFTLTTPVSVTFEATLWCEAGAQADVSLYSTAAPDVAIANSTLQSNNADGERVISAIPIALGVGTYFIKGFSHDAAKQAWGVGYRVAPV